MLWEKIDCRMAYSDLIIMHYVDDIFLFSSDKRTKDLGLRDLSGTVIRTQYNTVCKL